MDYFSLDFVRYGVCSELSPVELEKHSLLEDSPYYSTLNDQEFLVVLTEKWSLEHCKSFEEFMLSWLKEHIFSPDVPLEYILENYKRVYSTSKAVRVATRKGRDDFPNYLLKEYPNNEPLQDNIVTGGLERLDILAKYKSYLSDDSVLKKACRLGMTQFVLYYGRGTKYYTMASIIAKEQVVLRKRVGILIIAALLKDASILTDPYYLNHPNVSAEMDRKNIISLQTVFLYRHFGITSEELCNEQYTTFYSRGAGKLFKYYDEVGFNNWRVVFPEDVESLEWVVAKAKEDNVNFIYNKADDGDHYRILDSFDVKKCYGSFYQPSMSIDMIEWFEAKLA